MSEADCEAGAGGARVTTPGGVPNLPVGALTLDTLVSRLEDMSPEAMRARAGERWPSIFGYSTGGDIMSDLSLSGIIAKLFSGFNSVVANADPADIDGPEDLPGLLWDFITSLPVVGELVGLLEAIIGEYDGDDEVLLAIQEIFMPLRRLVQLVAGKDVDWPTAGEVAEGWEDLGAILRAVLSNTFNPGQNLWPMGMFPDADSVAGSGVWVFDPGVTRSSDSTGSVRATADGTMKALLSAPASVTPGQEVDPSIFVRWAGYVGAGTPVQLQMAEYHRSGSTVERVGVKTIVAFGPTAATGGWAELAGTYKAPEDGSVNEVRGRVVLTSAATAGTFNFDDAKAHGKLLAAWISDLPEGLQDLLARIKAVIDAVVQSFTGESSIGNTMEDLLFALQNIRDDVVAGVLGPGTIGGTIRELVNAIVGGAVGESGDDAELSDVQTFIELISSWANRGRLSFDLLGIRNNKPADSGLLPSERSNFNLSEINTQFSLAPGTSLIAFDYIEESMAIGVVSWIGWGVSGITEFYVNIYKVVLDRGDLKLGDLLHASPNVVGILEGTASPGAFISYQIDEEDVPAAVAGDLLAYELIAVGGTHTVRGRTFSLPVHQSAPIGSQAATRTVASPGSAPSSLAKTDIAWSQDAPWIGIAVDTGSGSDHHDPFIQPLKPGVTIPVPNWATHVDVVVLGKGGNGAPGIVGFYGNPGTPGSFNTATWVRGTHFSGAATIVEFEGSTVSIPGHSVTANNGSNGSGQRHAPLGVPIGRGPGTLEYNGIRAIGGVDQRAYGGNGAAPGGAGNGGHWFGVYTEGGRGASPQAWVQFRKDLLPGEAPGGSEGDTTPPNLAGLTVSVTATSSKITLTPSGAVDE